MRYQAFGRFCEYLGRIAYPPNFVGRPTGPFGAFLPGLVTGTPDLDFRLALQAPGCSEKLDGPYCRIPSTTSRTAAGPSSWAFGRSAG